MEAIKPSRIDNDKKIREDEEDKEALLHASVRRYDSFPCYETTPSAPPLFDEKINENKQLTRSAQLRAQDRQLSVINRRIANNPPNYEDINRGYNEFDRNFGDIYIRGSLLRKTYMLLSAQWILFIAISTLFTMIPHLRFIFRKRLFDKILLSSLVSGPFALFFVFLFTFEQFRRKFSGLAVIALTVFFSYLLSYVLSMKNCYQMILQILGSNISIISVAGLNYVIPSFCMRTALHALYLPASLSAFNIVLCNLFKVQLSQSWPYMFGETLIMSYLGMNTVSVFNSERLAIQPNEPLLALASLYCNTDLFFMWRKLIRPTREPAYQSI